MRYSQQSNAETEGRMWLPGAGGGGRGNVELVFNPYRSSLRENEKVLEVVIFVQQCVNAVNVIELYT